MWSNISSRNSNTYAGALAHVDANTNINTHPQSYTNADNFDVDGCSRVMDWPELLYGWQAYNPGGGDMQHVIAVSDDRGQNWEGKAGDDPVTPSATSIPKTCGGVAEILIVQICTE